MVHLLMLENLDTKVKSNRSQEHASNRLKAWRLRG